MRLANVGRGFKNSILIVVCHAAYSIGRPLAYKKTKECGEYSHTDENVKSRKQFSDAGFRCQIAIADRCQSDNTKIIGIDPRKTFDESVKNSADTQHDNYRTTQVSIDAFRAYIVK